MKDLLLKLTIIIPLIVFVDYLIMAIVGCTSCLLGFTDNFYQCDFCVFGKVLLSVSVLVVFSIIYPDVKLLMNSMRKHSFDTTNN